MTVVTTPRSSRCQCAPNRSRILRIARLSDKHSRGEPPDAVAPRRDGQRLHQEDADTAALVVVADDERHLGDGRIGLVAHETGVGHHRARRSPSVMHPDEVVDVVDLEQVGHQRLRSACAVVWNRRYSVSLENSTGPCVVRSLSPGSTGRRYSSSVVAQVHRDRRDERGEPLARRAHQLVHHAGHVEHGGEGARGRRPIRSAARSRPPSRSAASRAAARSRRRSAAATAPERSAPRRHRHG